MSTKNKKTYKIKKILNWINPTSPAKSMLLFAIAFAVIGGSYTAYKSFASPAHVLVNGAGKIYLFHGSGVKQTDSHGGLPNTTIWRLETYASVATKFKVFALSSSFRPNICTTYRFTSGSTNNKLDIQYRYDQLFVVGNGSLTYRKVCHTETILLSPGQYNTIEPLVTNYPDSNNFHAGDLYIKNISLEW